MAGLEGTIKTPFGAVQKKTALIFGGGIVVLGGIVWYRQRNSTGGPVDTTDAEINPATGYPYGSPEDAAALQDQAAYVSPAAPTGGSTTYPTTTGGYTSNSQWVQGVVAYMVGNDLVSDPTQLSAALGKFITGSYVTDSEVSLIQQAIAVQDFPPISGPNGYPPSLNRTNPVTPPPTTTTPNPLVTKPGVYNPPALNPTVAKGVGWYKVVKGDTLAKISAKNNVSVGLLQAYNTANGLNRLTPGEWVRVRGRAGAYPG